MLNRTTFRLFGLFLCLMLSTNGISQTLSITPITDANEYQVGGEVTFEIHLDEYIPDNPSFLHTWVDASGYRKLKLGNNPDNYYNPAIDVIGSGNDQVQITLRVKDDQTNWKKMLFRPNGKANSVRLKDYVQTDPTVNEWFTITIPVSDFDGVTDFTQLKNIEFPYSGGANHFDWDIYSIIFTGGQSPVVWLGPGNINNANNGNGGPGEVFAEWSINSQSEQGIPLIKLLANNNLIGSADGLSTSVDYLLETEGMTNILAEAWGGTTLLAQASLQIDVAGGVSNDIGIMLISPQNNALYEFQQIIEVKADISGNLSTDKAHLKVNGLAGGWRKLKIGNNPSNLYGPAVDVSQGGNTEMQIIMKDPNNSLAWSKIEMRPNGVSSNPIGLEFYWNQKQDLGDGWSKITIPMSAFDSNIDFTSLANLEFPYSKSAGVFELLIQDIRFAGGGTDYVWFGEEKVDNKHDGFGNPGQLLAELVQPDNGGYKLIRADLLIDDKIHSSDHTLPFSWNLNDLPSGVHTIQMILNLDTEQISSSITTVTVLDPVFNIPEITLEAFYPLGIIPTGKAFPIAGLVENIVDGVSFQTQLIIDDQIISTTDQTDFTFIAEFSAEGMHSWAVKVVTSDGAESISGPYSMEAISTIAAPNLSLLSPENDKAYLLNSDVNLQAKYVAEETGDLPYMEIINPGSGYRKLKIGNNPDNLYSPKINLIQDGNSHMDITINLIAGQPDLSKLIICPQEVTTNAPKLSEYWDQAEDLGDGWKKISIPLTAFDNSIDFSQLGYIAFPYSRDAGYFKFGVRSIEFTGGSTPFMFFGESKLDNLHDGFGNPGQLQVSIIMADQALDPERYVFFLNDLFVGAVDNQASSTLYTSNELGTNSVEVAGLMADGSFLLGTSSTFRIVDAISENNSIVLRLSFNQQESVSVEKAKLRYNKDFAYSFTLDDGLDDAYSNAFKILNGGYLEGNGKTYPGLFTTDGCGNDIPFTAGVTWFSVSTNYNDLHVNTPSYTTWNQLIELYNSGWDVLNHSYSHAFSFDTDYYWEIEQNQNYVYDQTGINMTHLVIPGGSGGGDHLAYKQAAIDYGLHASFAYKSDFVGYPKGIQTDAPMAWEGMSIYRGYKYDGYYTPANIMNSIDGIAANSSSTNHMWYNDFTHRVLFGEKAGSLQVETFEYYMTEIESRYGKSGTDAVWMASIQQVWEYLFIRDNVEMISEWIGNDLIITLDVSKIPADLRTKALSLIVPATTDYTIVVETPGVTISSNSNSGLINLEWDIEDPLMKSHKITDSYLPIQQEMHCYPNPVSDWLNIKIASSTENSTIKIYDLTGKIRFHKELNSSNTEIAINARQAQLDSGIYFVEHTSSGKKIVEKIIVK